MAITINGNGTITGVTSGAGKILQVEYTEKTDSFSLSTTNTWTDVTGMSLSITPSSTSNHVLVSVEWAFSGDNNYTHFRILRGSTVIYQGDASGNDRRGTGSYLTNTIIKACTFRDSVFFRDSPSTTSAVTYKLQMLVDNDTGFINRSYATNASYYARTASSITLMEVAG
jgi:hypothetical protein